MTARRLSILLPLLIVGLAVDCGGRTRPVRHEAPAAARFGERRAAGALACDEIDEASGLVASRAHPGVLWTHNDSGDDPRFFALDSEGRHLGIYRLAGAEARDWEDMALGPGPEPGRHYLFAADIGDNDARHELSTIYRVLEPAVSPHQAPVDSTIAGVVAIRIRFPDGPRDAETLVVDPVTADLLVVSKREEHVHVYRATFPQSTEAVITLEALGELPLQNVTGGDIAAGGGELLLKTYTQVLYWPWPPGLDLDHALRATPRSLPYIPEPQGEAVAWAADGSGYYTLSEERGGVPAVLYFYPRLSESDGR